MAVSFALLLTALVPGAAQASLCGATVHTGYRDIYGSGGDRVARLFYHQKPGGDICKVLRAVKWNGTPHYMYLRSCGFGREGGPAGLRPYVRIS